MIHPGASLLQKTVLEDCLFMFSAQATGRVRSASARCYAYSVWKLLRLRKRRLELTWISAEQFDWVFCSIEVMISTRPFLRFQFTHICYKALTIVLPSCWVQDCHLVAELWRALQNWQHSTVVELIREGVTKLFRWIEIIETLVFSFTY